MNLSSIENKKNLIRTIVISCIILSLYAFQWLIIDKITPLIYTPLIILSWILFVIIFITTIITLIKKYKILRIISFLPLFIMTISFLIILLVPFTKIWIEINFSQLKKEREEVIHKVYLKKLKPNVSHNSSLIHLDDTYSLLSMGGNDIVVNEYNTKIYILFYIYRGILNNYSGFVFIPKEGSIKEYVILSQCSSSEIKYFSDRWYYLSCH